MVDPDALDPSRYRGRELLGRGGMGEVHLAEDTRIGRLVAIKVAREDVDSKEQLARFVREARIQGRLEHPAIVPIYDLVDAGGRPYFVMKRASGETLAQVIAALGRGDPAAEQRYPLRRLLAAFQQLCLAVDYAHARGIVHRDLKPSNVMLGDFGEVYLLDWGIAKVVTAPGSLGAMPAPPEPAPPGEPKALAPEPADPTGYDEVLGTVGYMAPEQMLAPATVDARADVYSLGAVLFHLVAREPLHGRGTLDARARSTQLGADARPTVRAPSLGLPPELDRICERATAMDREERFQSARELHDALERYLAGDRDAQLRGDLVALHLERAERALGEALGSGSGATESRRVAMREAGLALALDPRSEPAAAMVARLMLAPPLALPHEVRRELDDLFGRDVRRSARAGAAFLFAFSVLLAVLVAMRLATPGYALFLGVPTLALGIYEWHVSRRLADPSPGASVLVGFALASILSLTGPLAGPLVAPPMLGLSLAAIFSAQHGIGRARLPVIVAACAAGVGPAVTDGALGDDRAPVVLFVAGTIGMVSHLLWRMCAGIARSREQTQLHAWHLRQLVATPPTQDAPAPSVRHAAAARRPSMASTPSPALDLDSTMSTREIRRS